MRKLYRVDEFDLKFLYFFLAKSGRKPFDPVLYRKVEHRLVSIGLKKKHLTQYCKTL